MIDSLGIFNYEDFEKQKAEVKFREGSRYKRLNCKNIVNELNAVYLNNHSLNAQFIVDYAKADTNSEFHKGLEWNDDKAANEYRKQQVHQIVSDIIIVQREYNPDVTLTNKNTTSYIVQAYSHIDSVSGYLPTINILQTTETREELIHKALKELKYWKDKYQNLVEFDSIIKVINNLNL